MNKREREQQAQMRQALGQGVYPQHPVYGGTGPKPRRSWPLVVAIVLLAAVATGLLVLILGRALQRAPAQPGPVPDFDGGDALLGPTADAGAAYLEETLFIGDSNTVRFGSAGLVEKEQILAESGIGIEAVESYAFLRLKGWERKATIRQAVELQKPVRALVMLGTNDIGNMEPQAFAEKYGQALDALHKASPETHLVVAAIPPISRANSYPKLGLQAIKAFNEALREVCALKGVPWLDIGEALADEEGWCPPGYTEPDGVHLSDEALERVLEYYRTHAWMP